MNERVAELATETDAGVLPVRRGGRRERDAADSAICSLGLVVVIGRHHALRSGEPADQSLRIVDQEW